MACFHVLRTVPVSIQLLKMFVRGRVMLVQFCKNIGGKLSDPGFESLFRLNIASLSNF